VSRPTQFFTIDPEWALANDPLTPLSPLPQGGEGGKLNLLLSVTTAGQSAIENRQFQPS
jgi:hypothetical protein